VNRTIGFPRFLVSAPNLPILKCNFKLDLRRHVIIELNNLRASGPILTLSQNELAKFAHAVLPMFVTSYGAVISVV
jgi:hypothetical protein